MGNRDKIGMYLQMAIVLGIFLMGIGCGCMVSSCNVRNEVKYEQNYQHSSGEPLLPDD